MALTYADMALLNSSMDRLGNAFVRNRVMAREREREELARGDRRREFDERTALDREQLAGQRQHWAKLEESAQLQTRFKELAAYQEQLQESFATLGEQVRAGAISNDEANDYVLASIETMPDLVKQQFLNNPQFKPIQSRKMDWSKVGLQRTPPGQPPADVGVDRAAAELEAQAASEQDPVKKDVLAKRAAALRSGIGRPDPTQYVEETEVAERDEAGMPVRTLRRRFPAGQVDAGRQGVLPLPKDKGQLVKGQKYQTAKGVATWDGQQFVVGE